MRWWFAIALATCALSGCGGGTVPCSSNDECLEGQICVESGCATLCTSDLHCPSGAVCNGQHCVEVEEHSGNDDDKFELQPQEDDPPVTPTVDTLCDDLETLYSTCPGLPYDCTDQQTARCVLDAAASFSGYCAGATAECGGDAADYCAVRECFGDDYDACIAEQSATCGVCGALEAEAGHCVGYGYDCGSRSEEQSQCFLGVLREYDDPCFLFTAPDIRCADGLPTIEGEASCKVSACFGLETFDNCIEYLGVECWLGG